MIKSYVCEEADEPVKNEGNHARKQTNQSSQERDENNAKSGGWGNVSIGAFD